ncbi:MAG TPA: hypothetical protein VLH09_06215 [Bryobacteraceae bacterium]|nr:hypothetical protein [Bryobacteraceae bacterium]
MTRRLGDYLKTAGLQAAAPEQPKVAAAPTTPAPAAAPAKVAEMPPALQAAIAAKADGDKKSDDKKDDDKKDDDKDDKKTEDKKEATVNPGEVRYDPALIKTAEQKWLIDNGYGVVPDPVKAAHIVNGFRSAIYAQQKQAEMAKSAELHKMGSAMFDGSMERELALNLALGHADGATVTKVAAALDLDLQAIKQAAREMRAKIASTDVEVAAGPSAFFGGNLATPARSGSSETQQAAERCANTVQMPAPALPGDTSPARGQDAQLMGFTQAANLPNNPGLNHGQAIAPGKAGV